MLSYLHSSRKQVIDATEGLSEAQWKFKSADDRWSVAEVVEHLILAEKGIFEYAKKTAESPANAPTGEKATDEGILKNIAARTTKVKAPETFVPKGQFGVGAPEVAKFKEARDQTLEWARTTNIDLRNHFAKSPMGETDGVQWIFYIAAHTERHVGQINEVKADPKFPKK